MNFKFLFPSTSPAKKVEMERKKYKEFNISRTTRGYEKKYAAFFLFLKGLSIDLVVCLSGVFIVNSEHMSHFFLLPDWVMDG